MENLNQIRELRKDIADSLYIKAAHFEELMERDFLHNRSEYGVSFMLDQMINDGWIYTTGKDDNEKYHTYKKFALSREMDEYELH